MTQDRLDLQRQAEKDHKTLTVRLRNVERELEEQETMVLETEMHNKTHTEDLNQRVQALEKQLKHNRQFIEVGFLSKFIHYFTSQFIVYFLPAALPVSCRSKHESAFVASCIFVF